jgi:GntR family transcriptional regulator
MMPMNKRPAGRPGKGNPPQDADHRERAPSVRTKTQARPAAQPLYKQVKDHLIRRVVAGDWRPRDSQPSEFNQADEYGLSQGTIRRAIEEMAVLGLVTRHSGRGTFVASHKGQADPFRFFRFVSESGTDIASGDVVYISSAKVPAEERVAAGLQIGVGEDVARIVRARCHEGQRVLLDCMFLDHRLCPDAEHVIAEQEPNSLYLALEQTYDLLIVHVDERLRSRLASDEEAGLLELPPRQPVLEVERLAFSLAGEPVEWRITVCRTDGVHYLNHST